MKRNLTFAAAAALLLVILIAAGCSDKKAQANAAKPAVPVTVATVAQQSVPVQLRAIGSVEAVSSVVVKTMVGGEITEVHFKEGQDVKQGQLLFTIDRRAYEAALQQAEANLARDTAQMKQAQANLARETAQMSNARMDDKRYLDLVKQGVIAQQQYDTVHTTLEALEAGVNADRAAIENAQAAAQADQAAIANARVNLDYCSIHSPLNGRTGSLMAFRGTVTKANDTTLLTINQVTPIYVNFAVPQQYLADIKKYMAVGPLKIQATIGKDPAAEAGTLTFVDNAVDAQTGTIHLKGAFPNANRRLWPGQFVDTVLTLTAEPNAIVVPSQALQNGQAGQFVYVVKADNTADSRPVVVGRAMGPITVVEKGLQPGEKVVVDGQLRLVPGAKVEIKSGPADQKEGRS